MAKKSEAVSEAAKKCVNGINGAIKNKKDYRTARWFLIGETKNSLHPSIVEILTTFFKVEINEEGDSNNNNVKKLKELWGEGVAAQGYEKINEDEGDKAVDALLGFAKEAKKMEIHGIFSRTAKIRDALIKAVKEYDRRLALEAAVDNKISKFFDASLVIAKGFVKDLKDLISGTNAEELNDSQAEEAKQAITKMYKTLCKLAKLDLDKDDKKKKYKDDENDREDGLIPWYNANGGKTTVEDIGKAILNLYDRKGGFFGTSRIKKFLKIFDKDKLFKERIKKACGIVEENNKNEEDQNED